ncbi:electron transfer flavoprotein subunit beta [Jiella mangrovi]|uniref:Electron transfer flavoprotein subunit beta n=1 Tax=Jiella mangrovi TaxID=2821407 RepID=A0ABS4BLS9_9HYPH|nr:electron transfer flavoprotein subunit beta [Jiella mangrovi]MBP0617672.1 electron transfer flavoprotein subunit beta [Jiella mangrovi]
MKTIVLLSDARNPVSGRQQLSRLEAQAIGLAAGLCEKPRGLHAGSGEDGVSAGLGHGLAGLDIIDLPATDDPLPALAGFIAKAMGGAGAPELILCGRRGEGGEETGLVPYRLAETLGLPILADAVAIRAGEIAGTLVVDQAMAKGARRRVTIKLPAIVTVHSLAPPPMPFAFGRMRRGEIRHHEPLERLGLPDTAARSDASAEERPHRARPKLMRQSGTASGGPNLHVGPEPDEAARLILDYLEANGIRRYGSS